MQDKLTYLQKIALEGSMYNELTKSIHEEGRKLFAFLFLASGYGTYTDAYADALKKEFEPELIDKYIVNLQTLTLPYDVWADSISQDILLMRGKCHSTTVRGGTVQTVKDAVIKSKIVQYLRLVRDCSRSVFNELIPRLRDRLPDFADVFTFFINSGNVPESEEIPDSLLLLEYQKELSLMTINIIDIRLLDFETELEGARMKYLVEVVTKDTEVMLRRRAFRTLNEAKIYKKTIERSLSDTDCKVDVILIEKETNDYEESWDYET